MNTTQKIMSAVAAIALIVSVTMMSFDLKSTGDTKANKRVITEQWYQLVETSSSGHSSQIILSQISEPGDNDDCGLLNNGNFCAVKLQFDGVTPPTSYPPSTTVATATASPQVSVVIEGTDEVYARKSTN